MLDIISIPITLMFNFLFLITENIRNKIITSVYQYFVYVLLYNLCFLYSAYFRIRYLFFAES